MRHGAILTWRVKDSKKLRMYYQFAPCNTIIPPNKSLPNNIMSRLFVSALFLCLGNVAAFVTPQAGMSLTRTSLPPGRADTNAPGFRGMAHPWQVLDVMTSSSQATSTKVATIPVFTESSSSVLLGEGNAIFEGIQTVLVVLTAGAFLLFGLSYVIAAFLIPKAAEQVEREAKELAPELWDEYQAKLGPGETMATRPDLLQELGNKIQPLIEQKYQAMSSSNSTQEGGTSASSPSSSSSSSAIDAEIVSKKEDESK